MAASLVASTERRGRLSRRLATYSVPALLIGLAVAGGSIWFATRSTLFQVSRFEITTTEATTVAVDGDDLAITPDGSRVIYAGNNGTQLFLRQLDTLAPLSLFAGAPRGPFTSPDGQWTGFVDGNTVLKKVAMTGGPAITVTTLDGSLRGAAWAPDDRIVFATSDTRTGLQRVSASGGSIDILTRPDRAQGESDHLFPAILPGGRAVLFTVTALAGGPDAVQVAVLDLQTKTRKMLVRGGSHALYVPGGYLVYGAGGALRAVAFDLGKLETRGISVPVVAGVVMGRPAGAVDAAVAANGTLAYISSASADDGAARTLVWVGRDGHENPIPVPPRGLGTLPRISPDDSRVAVAGRNDVWSWDFNRLALTRITSDPAEEAFPVSTPDSRKLIFSSERDGVRNLYWKASDGTGGIERLTTSPNTENADVVSPDGAWLIFTEMSPKSGSDVMQVELSGNHRIMALVQSPFSERNASVSRDGHWLAYEANDSGQYEVYVCPYPNVNGGHWQVSTGGGTRPLWSRNGQELFYVSPTGALMSVGVKPGPPWSVTTPTMVVRAGYFMTPARLSGRMYDVSHDGRQFLMIKESGEADPSAPLSKIVIVQNWGEELKRLVPAK